MLAAVLLAAGAASAQSHAPSDREVEALTRAARRMLPTAVLEDGSPVGPETEEERARPIISRTAEIAIIRRGELSGQMAHCGLDWENESFMPFMYRLRGQGWRGKTMAYVAMLHGSSQGTTENALEMRRDSCTPEAITAMHAEAAVLDEVE